MAITYATFNPSDKSADITLSGDNLTITSGTLSGWRAVRATIPKSTGKWVWEISKSANNNQTSIAFGDIGLNINGQTSDTPNGLKIRPGTDIAGNGITVFGTAPTGGTGPYMVAVDLDAGKGWIALGNVWSNSGDPAAGTNPSFTFTANMTSYIANGMYGTSNTLTLNSGASAFNNTVPIGFNSGWFTGSAASIPVILNTRREL